jgi:hypothetical protein
MSHPALDRLLADRQLTDDSLLYREVPFSALTPAGASGLFRIQANATPSEAVVDLYGAGHIVQAEHVGAGLAFAGRATPNWQETMEMRVVRAEQGMVADPHVEVAVRVRDLLAQGGRAYPVESVTVEQALYWTLPAGAIEVRVVDAGTVRQ